MSSQLFNLPSSTLTLHINRGVLVGKPIKNLSQAGQGGAHFFDSSSKDTKAGISL